MKLKQTILVVGMAFAALTTAASAADTWTGDVDLRWMENTISTKTRAEVLFELARARQQGNVHFGEAPYASTPTATGPARTRTEVRAEARRAAAQANTDLNSIYLGG
jgi:hypothetical protein